MTWEEFVAEVERQMEEQGISKDEELWYIDIHGGDGLDVYVQDGLGIGIF